MARENETAATTPDARQVAQLLVDSGFTKEDALRVQESLALAEGNMQSQSLEQQTAAKNTKAQTDDITNLILKDEVSPSLKPQGGFWDSNEAQRMKNIALISLTNFERTPKNPLFTWEHNGCSSPAGLGGNVDIFFNRACIQHDFGYRNGARYFATKNLVFKRAVDIVFLNNMNMLCTWYAQNKFGCSTNAAGYFAGVSNIYVDNYWLTFTW